ncbi:MAG: hypothetical protein OEV86_15110 [Candidatus Krumholzibacteria bacterium]|nr:hypothetical protein [Candidatus Krumholzibacteria bacterium]
MSDDDDGTWDGDFAALAESAFDALEATEEYVAELQAALRDAVAIIDDLAGQQEMCDDWYVSDRDRLAELAGEEG